MPVLAGTAVDIELQHYNHLDNHKLYKLFTAFAPLDCAQTGLNTAELFGFNRR